jgi:hypothetical protein
MRNYKKQVELPTGVKTTIKDTLEGRICVEFKVRDEFNKELEL